MEVGHPVVSQINFVFLSKKYIAVSANNCQVNVNFRSKSNTKFAIMKWSERKLVSANPNAISETIGRGVLFLSISKSMRLKKNTPLSMHFPNRFHFIRQKAFGFYVCYRAGSISEFYGSGSDFEIRFWFRSSTVFWFW